MRPIRGVLLLLPLCWLSGCYGAAAGFAVIVLTLLDDDGGGQAPPVSVTDLRASAPVTPDRIQVEFTLSGGSGGKLDARVDFQILAWISDRASGERYAGRVTPLPGFSPGEISRDEPVRLAWDARTDLQGHSAHINLMVTPSVDGREADPVARNLRAGNTPVSVRNAEIVLTARADLISAAFDLIDAESDRVNLVGIEIAAAGGRHHNVPLEIFDRLRRDFPSAPAPDGEGVSFSFSVKDLEDPRLPVEAAELRQLSLPGFKGDFALRISLRDYEDEELAIGESSLVFDNNDAPLLNSFPILPEQARSGIIPIRYTLQDREGNPAYVEVEVDLDDGIGPRRANEFPTAVSHGRSGLDTRDSSRVYTFLWDALSQARGDENVRISIRARDLEESLTSSQDIVLAFPGLSRVSDLETGRGSRSLAAGDLDLDGFLDLVVANESSSDVTHFRGSEGGLEWVGEVQVGSGPVDLAIADFDGDGGGDIAVVNRSGNSLTVIEYRGQGLVRVEPEIPVAALPQHALAGRFTDDEVGDLLVVHAIAFPRGKASFLRGGEGGLALAREMDVGRNPSAVLSHDFNGDGAPDVVVANRGSDYLTFLAGTADGPVLRGIPEDTVAVGDGPAAMTVGRFEGPGGPRGLAVANSNSGDVTYLRSASDRLVVVESFQVDAGLEGVQSGDFDGDGYEDVAVADGDSARVAILRGGLGGFAGSPAFLDAGVQPRSMSSADFDGDGFPDLAVANQASANLTHLRGGPQGLRRMGELPAGINPVAVSTGDFDGDGLGDLAVVNSPDPRAQPGSVTHLKGSPGGLGRFSELLTGTGPNAVAVGDHDQDGFLDVTTANSGSNNVTYLQGGFSGLRRWGEVPTDYNPLFLTSGHFDGDGFLDLAVANSPATVSYLRGGADGLTAVDLDIPVGTKLSGRGLPRAIVSGNYQGRGFSDAVVGMESYVSWLKGAHEGLNPTSAEVKVADPLQLPNGTGDLASGDFDDDGYLDVAVANTNPLFKNVSLVRGGPTGLEWTGENIRLGGFPAALRSGDFDGDGIVDVAVANRDAGTVHFLKGVPSATGLLEDPKPERAGDRPVGLAAADFDGDGFLDAAATNEGSGTVTLLRGGPNGLVRLPGPDPPAGSSPEKAIAGEFDGDGFPDLIVMSTRQSGLRFLRGSPAGLRPAGTLASADLPFVLGGGDFDGDGFTDLAVASRVSSRVTYFRQKYLVPHDNRWVDPVHPGGPVVLLQDPRNPSRFKLELPPASLSSAQDVCLVPAEVFPFAQPADAFLTVLTEPARILRESTELRSPARLTLRLRHQDVWLVGEALKDPRKLRVFRKDPDLDQGRELQVPDLTIVDLPGASGVVFSIHRFGTYLVALERRVG